MKRAKFKSVHEAVSPALKSESKIGLNRGWKEILAKSIATAEQLSKYVNVDTKEIRTVTKCYPMRINPYYLSLIKEKHDPIWKQAVPDLREIEKDSYATDPLHEEKQSPIPNLIHRYPDRVVLLVSNQCAMFCRYCMRKRRIGEAFQVDSETIDNGLAYIERTAHIRDVILSGGDPLLLEDEAVYRILSRLRSIPHVEIIRIHTRVPCTLPQRVTRNLVSMIKEFHPVYVNTHFNHPAEITDIAASACLRLADAGIPLGCQTVLLKGVNDNPAVMAALMRALLKTRVRPYYIHQADQVKGTAHFSTSIETGLNIMRALRGNITGLCLPSYMIDLPGGGGKIPLLPEYVKSVVGDNLIVENYQGKTFSYPLGRDGERISQILPRRQPLNHNRERTPRSLQRV